MNARFAAEHEINNWNNLIINNPDGGNIFSSYEFAYQKESGGYKARFVIVDELNLAITILEKNTLPLGKFWYLPKGPGVLNTTDLNKSLNAIRDLAVKNSVFAIRFESELSRDCSKELIKSGYIKARPIVPNPSTIHLDLSPSLVEILANINQKARHAINRAKRDGVTIKLVEPTDENCKLMYKLLQATAEGQFGIRSYDYFKSFWQSFYKSGHGQLFFAYVDNETVAGAYALILGSKSTYKDGASVRERPVYGASHLLQWTIIEWAKNNRSLTHDFCGSPPSDEIENTAHKHYGVGRFKLSFSRHVLDFIGCYDYVISPAKYKIWIKLGEKLAHRLHYYKHKDSYY